MRFITENYYSESILKTLAGVFASSLMIFTIQIQTFAQNQTVSEQPTQTERQLTIVVIFFVLVVIAAWKLSKRRKLRERRYFTDSIKKLTLRDQNYKCAICKRGTGVWDYDHIDGNRSNNDADNCQVLCPNCHAKKTRGLLKEERKFSFTWRIVVGILVFFIMLAIVYFMTNKI
jgi:hypothetical protein